LSLRTSWCVVTCVPNTPAANAPKKGRLKLCLDHARIDLDNNIIERAIRAVAVGRKNWLFAGSDEGAKRAALLISLAGTCRMLDLDPVAYFSDVLLRMRIRPEGADCADLTPIQWKNRA